MENNVVSLRAVENWMIDYIEVNLELGFTCKTTLNGTVQNMVIIMCVFPCFTKIGTSSLVVYEQSSCTSKQHLCNVFVHFQHVFALFPYMVIT